MPNALYLAARQAFLEGKINWLDDTIRVVLVSASYTVNLTTHSTLADIPSAARIATSPPLSNKSTTSGYAKADNVIFSDVSGADIKAVVVYQDTGNESTSRLIAYLDAVGGLPLTPSGGNVALMWEAVTGAIFQL